MTRMLIVDDDPSQLRLLARVISARQPGLSVATANSGASAIELLRTMPVDLVLTDLQMPDPNGFALVHWLLSHQPHVQVFTMTAYPDDEAVERLRALGSVECYTKPLDVTKVLEHLASTLAQGVRGHVRNIGLPSLMQLIEMERKTCTLTVESEARIGYLYVADGTLVDARHDECRGEDAAIAIAGWPSPAVTITNTCASKQRTVERSLGYIIMESMRLSDEAKRDSGELPVYRADADELLELPVSAQDASDAMCDGARVPSVSCFPLSSPSHADAIAIIETESGRIRTSAGHFDRLDVLLQLVARVYANKAAVVEQLGDDDAIEELVMTTGRFWTMTRPLATSPPSLAVVVFDPQRTNVVLERLELEAFVSELEAWSTTMPSEAKSYAHLRRE